jgi:hypothetical protein
MGSIKKPLFNIFVILCLAITVATMGPNSRVAEAESVFDPNRFENVAAPAPFGPGLEVSTAFHFLQPIAAPTGDPSKFDPDLLNYLVVDVCAVTTTGCDPVIKFTSPQIRITFTGGYGNFYIVNWDTNKSNFSSKRTYRVNVSLIDEVLGSVDLTPSMYSSFGRTWPIKFMIEKDARLRTKILAFAGKNLWQVADDLRTELGICGDALQQALLAYYPNADADLVTEVVNGVCQEVELFPTTKIADKATRDALAFYDTSTGQMVFAGDTNILKNLRVNDVLAGREGPSAPYGYLRKVTSIRKNKGIYTLGTVQAKFTEAIKRATLQTSGPLEPADQSQTFAAEGRSAEFDVGKSVPFKQHIDVTIDLNGGDDELGGSGTINVVGDVEIQAGYNIGAGIELCKTPPFACADRVEAWMGFVQKSSLHVTGKFDGHLHKEYAYPIEMSPIFFMIGPIPVWLVPEVNVVVGLDGRAHVDFEFNAAAQSTVKPYIKWTEDEGWKDLTAFAPLSHSHADVKFAGNAELEGYARLDAALLLYGVIGPSMDGSLGIVGKAQTGQSPFWEIHGHVKAGIGLKSAFMDLFDVDAHDDLFEDTFDIAESGNLPPQFSNVKTAQIAARVNEPVNIGEYDAFGLGAFNVVDPEGEGISKITATEGNVEIPDLSNATFSQPGKHTIKVTATDVRGATSDPIELNVFVFTPPNFLELWPSATTIPAGVQFFAAITAHDDTDKPVPCGAFTLELQVTAPDVATRHGGAGNCVAWVRFNQQGARTLTVKAKDGNGTIITKSVSVNVTAPPANPYPEIAESDVITFSVMSRKGPLSNVCPDPDYLCEAPSDVYLFNGVTGSGDYFPPLFMSVRTTDPTDTVTWKCITGITEANVTYDSTFAMPSCSPAPSLTDRVMVYAIVKDVNNQSIRSEARIYRFLPGGPN